MELEFDVKINTSVLYDYMLYHTYTSFSGLFGSVVGALLIVAYGLNSNLYFLAAGLVVLLYIPWTLFFRAKKALQFPRENLKSFVNGMECLKRMPLIKAFSYTHQRLMPGFFLKRIWITGKMI